MVEPRNEKSGFQQGQKEPKALKRAKTGPLAFWEVRRHSKVEGGHAGGAPCSGDGCAEVLRCSHRWALPKLGSQERGPGSHHGLETPGRADKQPNVRRRTPFCRERAVGDSGVAVKQSTCGTCLLAELVASPFRGSVFTRGVTDCAALPARFSPLSFPAAVRVC